MKHEMTTCPTCGKALPRCTDEKFIPETVKAVNRGYGWSWDATQCQRCWEREANREGK